MKDWKYKKIMNSKEWKMLRDKKIIKDPLCEECAKKGKIRSAQEVHHIIPIETAHDLSGMEALAFDYNNLESVCRECHHEIHKKMGSHDHNKENMKSHQKSIVDKYLRRMF